MKKSAISTMITIIVLEILSIAGGVVGFLESKKQPNEQKPKDNKNYEITYKYYIDNVAAKNMPENSTVETGEDDTEETVYSFERYVCTNDVQGEFNVQEWKFTPNVTADSTCKLYFVSNFFEVTVNVTNGKLNELSATNNKKVKKGESLTYDITPNEGYEYNATSSCSNGATATWNAETNKLTVSNVTAETKCEIKYDIKQLTVNVKVENGTTETESNTVEYGKDIEFTFTPNENMVYDKMECKPTIKSATYQTETNKLTISNVTADSTCTVTFKQNAFRVTLNITNGTIVGDTTKDVKKTGKAIFNIKANEGYTTSPAEMTCENGATITSNGEVVRVDSVTQDTTCSMTLKESNTAVNNE